MLPRYTPVPAVGRLILGKSTYLIFYLTFQTLFLHQSQPPVLLPSILFAHMFCLAYRAYIKRKNNSKNPHTSHFILVTFCHGASSLVFLGCLISLYQLFISTPNITLFSVNCVSCFIAFISLYIFIVSYYFGPNFFFCILIFLTRVLPTSVTSTCCITFSYASFPCLTALYMSSFHHVVPLLFHIFHLLPQLQLLTPYSSTQPLLLLG